MKKSRLLGAVCACAAICLFPVFGQAAIVVLDFEGQVSPGSSVDLQQSYSEDGFKIERNNTPNPYFELWSGNPPPSYPGGVSTNGTDMLVFSHPIDFLSIYSKTPGELFTPQTIDLAMVAAASGSTSLRIEAHFQAGNSISDQLTVTNNWQSFALPGTYASLVELRVFDCAGCGGIFGMDNLVLQTIPIPAALWLFGGGLLGLIGMAKRKAT